MWTNRRFSPWVRLAGAALLLTFAALPSAAAGPAGAGPAIVTGGCQGEAEGTAVPMSVQPAEDVAQATAAATPAAVLPDPTPAQYCWDETRWVYAGYCCFKLKNWYAVFKLQRRDCCEFTGCSSWQDTGSTDCTGIICG